MPGGDRNPTRSGAVPTGCEAAEQLLALATGGRPDRPVTHLEHLPARPGRPADWPPWVPELVRSRLALRGIHRPWEHQVEAAELVRAGQSVVIATGTASGKSLGYQLPVLSALLSDERATALYLSPTKALGADQLRSVRDLTLLSVRAAAYDGDTPREERDWVRAHARWIFTNPDMLHVGLLPAHQKWSSFLRRLRYVVVDECHSYRGVFGSHVGHVLRRLRRLCARYHADPVFVLASATAGDPAGSASRLTGLPVRAVTSDASPRGDTAFALWEPPLTELRGEQGAPVRRSALSETARLLSDLVSQGARTLAFVRSRRGAEIVALQARTLLADAGAADLARRIAAYRAGFLAEERRALEAALSSGRLLGVAATNALELGVDITGLDAVVLCGFPGTVASMWQQAGRAGRRGTPSLVIFVARDDPLDTYLVHHPQSVFGRPVEATVTDPANPYVLGPQLCAAAAEAPLVPGELPLFGGEAARAVLDGLAQDGTLRRRAGGWYWTRRERPVVDIRGTGGEPVSIVHRSTGQLLGTVDPDAAHRTVHTGAVYLHQGVSYVVDSLNTDEAVALAHAETTAWTTNAREVTEIDVVASHERTDRGPVALHLGTVDVTNQVVSFQRRRVGTGEVLDETALDLPPRLLRTKAVWYTVEEDALVRAGLDGLDWPGALHAAEHAAIGLLPLFASCDRWDIGGVSTAMHPDTGRPTVFVYDGHPGGAGFAEHGYAVASDWLAATRAGIASCECSSGCPSCVQSPKCGNGNDPLDKAGALTVLDLVLAALPVPTPPSDGLGG